MSFSSSHKKKLVSTFFKLNPFVSVDGNLYINYAPQKNLSFFLIIYLPIYIVALFKKNQIQ